MYCDKQKLVEVIIGAPLPAVAPPPPPDPSTSTPSCSSSSSSCSSSSHCSSASPTTSVPLLASSTTSSLNNDKNEVVLDEEEAQNHLAPFSFKDLYDSSQHTGEKIVTPIDELAKWKRADLLQLCEKYGVSKTGNRQVLAQRLIAASDPTALDNIEKSIQNYLGKPRSGVAAMHSFYKEYFNTVDKVNMNEWMTSHPAVLTRGKAKFIHGLVKIPLVNVKCILDYLHWEGDKKFDFDLSRLERTWWNFLQFQG